ncbi:RelA/SpoT domain-containing protein [Saccharopolyspora sp. NFXS83]|uniref:RelA/SpoT domain-containing protein n=1 Tax=Saccharopolyspora sp. NFXS83 TaxID=2993560 RepID=UPI003A4DE283
MYAPVPAEFRGHFDWIESDLDHGRQYIQARLTSELSSSRPVAIQARVKNCQSAHEKIQKGDYPCLSDVEDLIAARIVVLHPADVRNATEIVKKIFPVVEERNIGAEKPTDFRYKQPHLIVRIPDEYCDRHPELSAYKAEIQLTTYIQHALQESVHDITYKGEYFSWLENRMDARLRGLLEVVDDMLENVSTIAKIADEPAYALYDKRNEVIDACLQIWDRSTLPPDLRRMATTIESLLTQSKTEISELIEMTSRHSDLVSARSLSAVDKVLGIILREKSDQLTRGLKRQKVYISNELAGLVDECENIPKDKRMHLQ